MPELRAKALEFEHIVTGAKLLHLHTDDTENCFAAIFPTPPPDETGLPHIMEHSVLAGSEKYPVREPFFELIKMSMATFINAFTSQCFTAYPVCTTVERDFFNLADVYMDAIFHPQLTKNTFQREGHHLALKDNTDLFSPLIISGIVYSEMMGYWSTPDNMIANLGTRGLFPDTPLGHDSGGNPDYIPTLSYEQFKDFHATYYHPSNAYFFLYGNISTQQHLDFLEPLLNPYSKKEVSISIPRQSRWKETKHIEQSYPIGSTEETAERTYIVMNWLVDDASDPDASIAWSVLSEILIGHDAAPLRKAIIDSKLGADLYGGGESSHGHELVFEAGIKGSEPDRVKKFEDLILTTLENIADSEISPEAVDTAIHQLSYHHLEVEKQFPMKLLWLCGETWPYNRDPLTFMNMKQHLEDCRNLYITESQFFNSMIRKGLLKNRHRITVVISPEQGGETKAEQAFAKTMAKQRATLSEAKIAEIAKNASALSVAQTQPNTPEQLESLPQLKVKDLPGKPLNIPTAVSTIEGMTVLRNDVFANGVNYLGINIDLSGLPPDLYSCLPRFARSISKMGAAGENFAQIAQRKASVTGSLECNMTVHRHASDSAQCLRHLHLGMKTIDNNAEPAFELLRDLIFEIDPRDTERLRDLLIQTQTSHRINLINNAMPTAMRRAGRGLTPEAALNYMFGGSDALKLLTNQLADFDEQAEIIMQQIEKIRDFLRDRTRWTISFTGNDTVYEKLESYLRDWAPSLVNPATPSIPQEFKSISPPREGLAAPIKVAHCAKVMPAPEYSDPVTPLYELGLYLANFDYLLPEIRFKGNAYGAGSQYNARQGTLSLFSFNDPHIAETLSVFDELSGFIRHADWSQTDVDRAIIGSAKKIVQPIRPAEATLTAMVRHICGETDELRAQRYSISRSATPESIKKALLNQLEEFEPNAGICVAASHEHLEEANRTLGTEALKISDILGGE